METDELSYNVFYLLLRNDYRKKYDFALTKCWTICVPCGDSLRDLSITKEFIDDHVLKPLLDSSQQYISTDEKESHLYEIENHMMKLINGDEQDDDYNVQILSIEKGYNKEFQPYKIIILDKPIHRKYRKIAQMSQSDKLLLNRSVSSYKDAIDFLNGLPSGKSCSLNDLLPEIEKINQSKCKSIKELKQIVQNLIRDYWATIMRKQSLDIQRDARFQKLLSISLEIFVMHRLTNLHPALSYLFRERDLALKRKIDDLIDNEVSPSQLGVKKSLTISMPSAIVELATLDSQKGPLEKLICLKGTLDFIIAEIKGAIADAKSRNDFLNDSDNRLKTCVVQANDLIPLLLYVIIKCRCEKLYTDLFYIENFIWSISPHDGLSYTLVTFKAALSLLAKISTNNLHEKNDHELKAETNLDDSQQNEVKASPEWSILDLENMLCDNLETS